MYDLFQAGCVGLVKASKSFDPQRGYAFSTYAVPVILGEIKRIFRDGGTVKVGRTLKERSMKAARIREKMANEMGREPTISELAEELGVDVEEASELITVSLPPVSLTVSEEDGGGQNDIPVESDDNDISDRLALKQVMDKLPERDRKLIKLRYFDGLTQNSTAELLWHVAGSGFEARKAAPVENEGRTHVKRIKSLNFVNSSQYVYNPLPKLKISFGFTLRSKYGIITSK